MNNSLLAEHVAVQQDKDTVKGFDAHKVLHDLKHYLPSQTPLKDFIHHNSLHAFQHLKFYDGIFKASNTFGYKVTLQLNEYRKRLIKLTWIIWCNPFYSGFYAAI